MDDVLTVIGPIPSGELQQEREEGEGECEAVTVLGPISDRDLSMALGERDSGVPRSRFWDKLVNQLLPMCEAMLKSREGKKPTRTEEVLREELKETLLELRENDFDEYEELLKLYPCCREFEESETSDEESDQQSDSLLDERQQCARLAELVQEYSSSDLRQYLNRNPGLVEVLGGFLSTAVCQSTLQIKTENGFSARNTLMVLHEFGADLEFKNRLAFRSLLFEFDDEVTDYSYRRQQFDCLLYFVENMEISPETLTCEGLDQEQFRLLEWWYHRDLDIKFAKNIQLFYDMHHSLFEDFKNLILPYISLKMSPSIAELVVKFVGPLKRVVWNPVASEIDYDGTIMRSQRTGGHRL